MALTWRQVLARRLDRHGLVAPVPADRLVEQVGAICGAHAQVMSGAEVSIGLRVAGITRSDIRSALWEQRSLVKSFGPRGTVHVLDPADLPAWNAVLGAAHRPPGFPPEVRLNADRLDAVVEAIDGALTDAPDLTIDELDAEVVKRAGRWAGDRVMPAFQELWPRWRQAVTTAAFRGVLCFGPNRGARTTYASPRRWLGTNGARDAGGATSADDATRLVLRRYLHAYGPARPEHVARWLGATPAWAKDAFRVAADELERVDVEGEELWQLAGDGPPLNVVPSVRLLPYFDAYAVGSHPRERVFPGPAAERALARTQAGNLPVLVVDGTVVGIWHQRRSGAKVTLTVEPFRSLTRAELRRLDEQVERIGEIQEAAATLTIGTVTTGPHA
jgi:DNA glycosylase AlkZ-like